MSGQARFVSYSEAARAVGRHPQTIRRWVREGHLFTFYGKLNRQQVLLVDRRMREARRKGTPVSGL